MKVNDYELEKLSDARQEAHVSDTHPTGTTMFSDLLSIVRITTPLSPSFSYDGSLLRFLGCDDPSVQEKLEKAAIRLETSVEAYGLDRPVAIVDLCQGVWAFTSQQSCRACYLSRLIPEGQDLCMWSDKKAAVQCYQTRGAGVYKCANLGLIDIVVPIKLVAPLDPNDGEVVAAFCCGQYGSPWRQPQMNTSYKCGELQSELARSIKNVRKLECDIQAIPLRLKATAEALKNETTNTQGEYCTIAAKDICHVEELLRQELSSDTSLERLREDAASYDLSPGGTCTADLAEAASVHSITGGTVCTTKDDEESNKSNYVGLFEWTKPSPTIRRFSWQRWGYLKMNMDANNCPATALRNYADYLDGSNFSNVFDETRRDLSRTLLSLQAESPVQSAYLSGGRINIPDYPGTNPGLDLLGEGLWNQKPEAIDLSQCGGWKEKDKEEYIKKNK
jgi:hypothetical protein